jgi:hypothetical protein
MWPDRAFEARSFAPASYENERADGNLRSDSRFDQLLQRGASPC